MKNREYRALIAMAMTAALVVGSLTVAPTTALAAKESKKLTASAESGSSAESTTGTTQSSDVKALKDETVYAKVDGTGSVKEVIVSDELKNVTDKSEIDDVSTLKDIENVKGDEEFTQSSDSLKWSLEGKDICYQGTSDQTLPVGIKITYTLDGQEVSAEDLEGKSGHLTVRYQYQNTTGSGSAYVPFLMVTGLIMDEDKVSNVTVTNGKVLSDGSHSIVLGMGIPQLQEELDTDMLDIPDYFEFEADVTDYEKMEGITVATNELFNELDTDKFDSITELEDSLSQLQSSSQQLVSGSAELASGLDTLLSSGGVMADGIHTLASGSATLKSGTSQLETGSESLASGNTLLSDNLAVAADKTQNQLLPGVIQLDDGVTTLQTQLGTQLPTLVGGLNDMQTGLTKIKGGTSTIRTLIDTGSDATGGASLAGTTSQAAKDTATLLQSLASKASVNTQETVNQVVTAGTVDTSEAEETLKQLLSADNLTETQKSTIEDVLTQLEKAETTAQTKAQEAANTAATTLAGAQPTADDVNTAKSAATAAGTASGISSALSSAATQTDEGVDTAIEQTKETSDKIIDEDTGVIAQLNGGVSQLKNGTAQLRAGIDGEQGLASGLGQLAAGAKEAAEGSASVVSGAKQLDAGAAQLQSGLNTLENGSTQLISGVQQLDTGAKTLSDGMLQFDQEGIEKLVSVFDGDVEGLLDKLNEMMDSSKSYNNFSGISDQMDGKVKFIFVTK